MERKFFKLMSLLRKYNNSKEKYLVSLIFPESGIQEHLTDKMKRCIDRGGYYDGMLWFYEMIDIPHKNIFDKWIEQGLKEVPSFIEK